MIVATVIRNPIDPVGSREIIHLAPGTNYLEAVDILYPSWIPARQVDMSMEIVFAIDGQLITPEAMDIIPDGASLVSCLVPYGGGNNGGKMILKIVASIAIAIVAAYTGGPASPITSLYGPLWGAAAAAGVALAGSMIINAVLPMNSALESTEGALQSSPTYSWDVHGNRFQESIPAPELYGTHRIKPPIIGLYVESDGDIQTLNVLYLVAKWQVDSITDIKINGSTLAEIGVPDPQIRYGTNIQEVTDAFSDTRSDTAVGTILTTSFTVKNFAGNASTGIGIGLVFPSGLFVSEAGGIAVTSLEIQIQYKLTSSSTWINLVESPSAPSSTIGDRWSGGYWLQVGDSGYTQTWFELEAGSSTPGDHAEGDEYIPPETAWVVPGYAYEPGSARPICFWHWVEDATIIIPAGTGTPLPYISIVAAKTEALRKAWYKTKLPPGAYSMQAKIYIAPPTGIEYVNDCYWEFYQEIIEDDFTYPNCCVVALRAIATSKLSGALPSVDMVASRDYVWVFDPNPALLTYYAKPADNPAWQCYDLLHKCRYLNNINNSNIAEPVVFGVPHERIRYDDFKRWADFCDLVTVDKVKFTCDLYSDVPMSLRKKLDIVGLCGRGSVIQLGSDFSCVVEMPEDTPTQRFLFTAANIKKDSFQESFLPLIDRANVIEITYRDKTDDYKNKIVTVNNNEWYTSEAEEKKASLDLLGCTDKTMAANFGKFLLNCGRLLTATDSWTADINAIACLPGDIVTVPRSLVRSESSGRLLAGCTTTSLLLDREVTLEPDTTYHIIVQHQDTDEQEEMTVTAVLVQTTTDVIGLTAAMDNAPTVDAGFSLGEATQVNRLMRITSISRASDLRRTITAVEFVNEVFNDSTTIPAFPGITPSRKMIPPALLSAPMVVDWRLDAIKKEWSPVLQVSFNYDPSIDYRNLVSPISKIRLYVRIEDGDTHLVPNSTAYEQSFDWAAGVIETPAQAFDKKTLYMAASLVSMQGIVGPRCPQGILYVDITPQPAITLQTEIDADKGTLGYDYAADTYTAHIKWVPAGWEISPVYDSGNPPAGSTWYGAYPSNWFAVPVYPVDKAVTYDGIVYVSLIEAGGHIPPLSPTYWQRANGYVPVKTWNSGNNYYNFSKYVLFWGTVAGNGDIPAFDSLSFLEVPGIGDITGPDGVEITDADDLHAICLQASSATLDFAYSESYRAIAVVPFCKNGSTCSLDLTDPGLGLDWEYTHVTMPGGTGNTVDEVDIENAELILTAQNGLVSLSEMIWDYALQAPYIDGFAVMYRMQPDWWAWQTNAEILSANVDLGSFSNKIDWTGTGGKAAALNTFGEAYLTWYARGIPYFYFLLADGTNHELIRIDTLKVSTDLAHCIERGMEGTTARTWAAGTWFSYSCSEYIDSLLLVTDTSQRNLMFSPPIKVDQALHCSIAAYKLLPEETAGYRRSKYAWWDYVTERG